MVDHQPGTHLEITYSHRTSSNFYTLAATYEISRTLLVLFGRDVRVNSYLRQLWTAVNQRPHKL